MGERPHDQPQRGGQQRVAQRLATADVEDVLQPGETRPDEARVTRQSVSELSSLRRTSGHHEQQEQALGRLFGERRADDDGTQLTVSVRARVDRRLGEELRWSKQ